MKPITENSIETLAIESLQSLGWEYVHGLAIAPEAESSERESFEQIILTHRLRRAVARLNPDIPESAREQAIEKVLRIYSPDLLHNNETFHEYLVEKIKVPYQQNGYERSYEVALVDFSNLSNNEQTPLASTARMAEGEIGAVSQGVWADCAGIWQGMMSPEILWPQKC